MHCLQDKYKNFILLFSSVFFYAWGAPKFVFVIIGTTILDFYFVKMLDKNVFYNSVHPSTGSFEDFARKTEKDDRHLTVFGNDALQRLSVTGTTTYAVTTRIMTGDNVYEFTLSPDFLRGITADERAAYEKMLSTFKVIAPATHIGYSPGISQITPVIARPGSAVTVTGSGFTTRVPTGGNGEGFEDVHRMHLLIQSSTAGTDFDVTGTDTSITFTVPVYLQKGTYELFMSNPRMGIFTNSLPFEVSMSVSAPRVNINDDKLLKAGNEVLMVLKAGDYKTLEGLTSLGGLSWNENPQLDLTKSDISKDKVAGIPLDTKTYLFGYTDGKGDPIQLTIADYVKKWLYNRDYINAPEVALNEILEKSGNNINSLLEDSGSRAFIAYKFPGDGGFDWGTIYLFFDMESGDYKLRGIAKNQWGI